MTFRYKRAGTTSTYTITVGDVANAVVSAATSTSYRYIMRTFKIHKVTARGSAGAVGEAATVGLRYLGENTRELRLLDHTMKIDDNAMVSQAPPRFSLASFWHDVETATLDTPIFELTYFGDGEFFVDLHMTFLVDVDRYTTYTLSGGTALDTGGIYKGPLYGTSSDGLTAIGGTRL
jgi:hypothetical protein